MKKWPSYEGDRLKGWPSWEVLPGFTVLLNAINFDMFWWYYKGRQRWAFLTVCAQNAHRMCTECAPPFYSVRIQVRMRTTTIFCAQCAQPLRTDILCCAHSVRMLTDVCAQRTDTSCAHSVRIAHRRLWKFYPLSVRSAPTAHRCAPLVHPPV